MDPSKKAAILGALLAALLLLAILAGIIVGTGGMLTGGGLRGPGPADGRSATAPLAATAR
ncbi:hypothetical protein ACIPVK_08485 [Paeniglutamicibacter sp. MACA_103]|uniref:hypothetical protein n=1 Tax=Paeniglutamicibacter sp. MACA_103 TaxID=3377337 RepID=UPI003895837D